MSLIFFIAFLICISGHSTYSKTMQNPIAYSILETNSSSDLKTVFFSPELHKYDGSDTATTFAIKEKRGKRQIVASQCETEICRTATSSMLIAMNHNADPCEEFYEFVCGGQARENERLSQENFKSVATYMRENVTDVSDDYLQLFTKFYESCVNFDMDFQLSKKFNALNVPIETNLTGVFIDMILTQSMPLFDIGLDIGYDQYYQFQITLPRKSSLKTTTDGWSIVEHIEEECLESIQKATVSSSVDLDDMYESYKKCKTNSLLRDLTNFHGNMKFIYGNNNSEYNVDVKEIFGLLDAVQKLMPSETEIRQTQQEKIFSLMSINDLNVRYNLIDWKTFFNGISTNKTFSGDEKIQVNFQVFLDNMFNLIKKYKEVQLVKILRDYYKFQLYQNTIIPKATLNRYMYCMDLSSELMPDIITAIAYDLSRYSDKLTWWNYQTKTLFDNFKNKLDVSLESSELNDASKSLLKSKLHRINLKMIISTDYESIKDNYRNISISKDNFQGNLVQLLKNYRKIVYSLVGTNATGDSLLAYFVRPFYSQPKTFYNSEFIVYHPEIFHRISMNLPEHVKIAKLGLLLCRELAKHFDPAGRFYMTNDDIHTSDGFYQDVVERTVNLLVGVYLKNSYTLHGEELNFQHFDGNLLSNELIADNAGFKIVHDHFKELKNLELLPWVSETFSPEQIFFIAAAQEYCVETTKMDFMRDLLEGRQVPYPVKVQNIVSNSREFATAFKCIEGSAMRLDDDQITQYPADTGYVDYDYES